MNIKNYILFIILILSFFSCKKNQIEIDELNSFLQTNYEFNNRVLNKHKATYYNLISENPSRKIEKLNELDSIFTNLIFEIEKSKKKSSNKLILSKSKELLQKLTKIVNNRKDYLTTEYDKLDYLKLESDEVRLNYLKNKLVISMSYAFEYASLKTISCDGLILVEIDSIMSSKYKKGVKLTLTSKNGQIDRENRHILINNLILNGKESKLKYKIEDNYSFADIKFDSLKKGTYHLNGTLRYYEREGKIDIPFEKKFSIE